VQANGAVPNLPFDNVVLSDQVAAAMLDAYEGTKRDGMERGFNLCGKRDRDSVYVERPGSACTGDDCKIQIEDCVGEETEVVGLFHTHPISSNAPSAGDLFTVVRHYAYKKISAPLDCRAAYNGLRCEILHLKPPSNFKELAHEYKQMYNRYEQLLKMDTLEALQEVGTIEEREQQIINALLPSFFSYKFSFSDLEHSIREKHG